jgi:integrase
MARRLGYSPVIIPGMRRTKPKERARDRVLDDSELKAMWAASNEWLFGSFVRFALLTACRRTEATRMKWGELPANGNGHGSAWVLPSSRNKAKVELVRPLSGAAQAVLARFPRTADTDLIFRDSRHRLHPNLGALKKEFDRRCGVKNWRLHDLRRTSRTLMTRAGVLDDHAERCLGHIIGGVRGIYNRWDYFPEKKLAFEKLATLIQNIVSPQDAKVIPLQG